MCTQIYLCFRHCPCQLRYRLEECKHGRKSPQCKYVRTAVKHTHRDLCHWHARQRRKVEERKTHSYWRQRGRLLWPPPQEEEQEAQKKVVLPPVLLTAAAGELGFFGTD